MENFNNENSQQENKETKSIHDIIDEERQRTSFSTQEFIEANKPKKEKRTNLKTIVVCSILSAGIGLSSGVFGAYLYGSSSQNIVYQNATPLTLTSENTEASTVAQVASAVSDSVVEISTEQSVQTSFLQSYTAEGAGSGVIYTTNGYIVTNNHVIEDATSITVTLHDGTSYPAELIARDSVADIAVIKIEKDDCKPVILGNAESIIVGETAIAVGNPLGELGGTVTSGIVSALDRQITLEDGRTRNLLQTNAQINSGNSGGGLFNSSGELIGLVVAKSSGTGIEGIGFAIPVDDVKSVVEDLLNNGYVSGRPALGVSVLSVDDYQTALSYGLNKYGVYVTEVLEGSAADQAGVQANDYIVAIDDQVVESFTDLSSYLEQREVGETVTLQIERDRQIVELEVTLQENTTQN